MPGASPYQPRLHTACSHGSLQPSCLAAFLVLCLSRLRAHQGPACRPLAGQEVESISGSGSHVQWEVSGGWLTAERFLESEGPRPGDGRRRMSSRDNSPASAWPPPSAGLQHGQAALSFPISSACYPPSIRAIPNSLLLSGCLTLCYVPERSEIMRCGPSPENLTWRHQTSYPSSLSRPIPHSLGLGPRPSKAQ